MEIITLNNWGNVMGTKTRMAGLDILRIFAVASIFLFHCHLHMASEFGILTRYFSQGAVTMVLFFMISGFALYYRYGKNDWSKWSNVKQFYIRRLAGIYPLYFIVLIIYGLLYVRESLTTLLMLLQVEILALQGYFDTLYSFWNNSGTWFVSCILLCYFTFPFLCFVINSIKNRCRIVLAIFLWLISSASPVIASVLDCRWVYPKPFFRLLEFVLGMLTAKYVLEQKEETRRYIKMVKSLLGGCSLLLLIAGVTFLQIKGWGSYASYNFMTIPFFAIMLGTIGVIDIKENKAISFFAAISYAVYYAQGFVFTFINKSMRMYSNILKIVVATIVVVLLAVVMHYGIERPAKQIIIKNGLSTGGRT